MHKLIILSILSICSPYEYPEWSYHGETGPDRWPTLFPEFCAGESQSPIDININNSVYNGSLGPIEFVGYENILRNATMRNTGETVEITPNAADYYGIRGGGLTNPYRLVQFHFHWGSTNSQGAEHTINGRRYSLELHLVHMNEIYPTVEEATNNRDGLAVVAVLFQKSIFSGRAISRIAENLQSVRVAGSQIAFDLNQPLRSLLPLQTHYFRYNGSLTTPVCNEVVIWTVLADPKKIANAELEKFRGVEDTTGEQLEDNFRPVQPLNGRIVYRTFAYLG